jgi:hypothetical protein
VIRLRANSVVDAVHAVRGRAAKPDDDGMPEFPPLTTLSDVRAAVSERLPGATLRRGVVWRYLLTWRRQ